MTDMIQENEYRIERLEDRHYRDLCSISIHAFGFDPGINYYSDKNKTDYLGHRNLGFIAYSQQGQPAAFYGVYAYPVEYNGSTHVAVQSGDTMTHPAHGGKGLFTRLAKATYDLCRQEGIEFVFGFPNKNSYPGFVKKLNWVHHENLLEYRIRIFTLPLLKLVKKIKFLNPLYNLYVSLVLSLYGKFSDFGSSLLMNDDSAPFISRSELFLNYKTGNGIKKIRSGEINFLIKLDGFLYLGDLSCPKPHNPEVIISRLKKLAFLIGADTLVFFSSPGTTQAGIFESCCKPLQGLPVGYLNFNSQLPLEKLRFVLADLDTF